MSSIIQVSLKDRSHNFVPEIIGVIARFHIVIDHILVDYNLFGRVAYVLIAPGITR